MNAARQPMSRPIRVPSGTPTTVDTAMPPMITDIALPWRLGATRPAATTNATPTNRPWSAPVRTRARISVSKPTAASASRLPATKAASDSSNSTRRRRRVVRAVRIGAPIEIPSA